MSRRIPHDIAQRIFEDNKDFLISSGKDQEWHDLIADLLKGKDGYLRDIVGADEEVWRELFGALSARERNWLDAPWLLSEFYFYRRVVDVFGFFHNGHDMFRLQKEAGLLDATHHIQDIADSLQTLVDSQSDREILEMGVFTSLWGNKQDLSLWPKTINVDVTSCAQNSLASGQILKTADFESIRPYILDNQFDDLADYLLKAKTTKPSLHRIVDIVVDNAGFELVSDFIFAHVLLSSHIANKVRFRAKAHPTFVSDATIQDCLSTIKYLQNPLLGEHLSAFGDKLQQYVDSKQFEFISDLFWCQPIPFWNMPDYIVEELADSMLVVVKGDANYRRLLGDRQWPLSTSSKDVLSYWLTPVCALRTFKAEIGCGISPADQIRAASVDSNWMVSGKWAVVQFFS